MPRIPKKQLKIGFAETEYDYIKELAKMQGKTMSRVVRECFIRGLTHMEMFDSNVFDKHMQAIIDLRETLKDFYFRDYGDANFKILLADDFKKISDEVFNIETTEAKLQKELRMIRLKLEGGDDNGDVEF